MSCGSSSGVVGNALLMKELKVAAGFGGGGFSWPAPSSADMAAVVLSE